VAVLVILAPLPVRMGMVAVLQKRSPFATHPFHGPGPDGGFHPVPAVKLGVVTTRHGLGVYAPMPDEPELVWDAPLPAAAWPPVDLDLALRRPGDLGSGFVIRRDPAMPHASFPPPRHAPTPVDPTGTR
jgi:hypothetical protein